MHPYVTDSRERGYILMLVAGISVLCAWLLFRVLVNLQVTVPWWVDAPSVMGFYGVLYKVFDKWLWRTPVFRQIGLVKVPCIEGVWEGYVSSSFDEHQNQYAVVVTIRQTWTEVSLVLQSQHSRSHSLVASIIGGQSGYPWLNYEYLNEPSPDARSTMHSHRGSARLMICEDRGVLEGQYYTGRDRQNYGVIYVERMSSRQR